MGVLTIGSFKEFEEHLGKSLGSSDYFKITQDRINAFGEATIDPQWIHTDPERAKSGPFGTTIAHGYLTVSLIPYLWKQVVEIVNVKMMVNYGVENLKFNKPVPVDGEVKLHVTLESITDLRGITKAVLGAKLEIKGEKKPAYTGSFVFLYHFNN